ncbi:MAG: MSMEG_0569 family flavin-dependent oxidoreductase [Mycobacteriales bacterium]
MTTLPACVPVAVIGGGQAGLSLSWWLRQHRVDHVVLERHRVGHEWRNSRWDSFCLVTPNWQCDLPGFPYAGDDPDGFMVKDEIVGYLEAYAHSFDPPVLEGVDVTAVRRSDDGRFSVTTSHGEVRADAVVVATGGYHRPIVPAFAEQLAPSVTQLHSCEYRNAQQLPDGAVLVVGSGQSGAQIAEDLHLAGRRVHLAVGDAPRCARFYRGRDVVAWLHDMGQYDLPVTRHPLGEAAREKTNHYVTGRDGGRDIDLRSFALDGMQLYGRAVDADATTVRFQPGLRTLLDASDDVYNSINTSIDRWIEARGIDAPAQAAYVPVWEPAREATSLDLVADGVTAIVWCIGFRPDWSWLHVPVLAPSGHPVHDRGISPVPGLAFLGLPWLHTWGSGRFASVGRDAEHIASALVAHLAVRPLLPTA